MKKVILIPDSFKGTLSSSQICNIIDNQLKKHFSNCEVISIPVADGGEGSTDCFLTALGGEKCFVSVAGPFFQEIESFYGLIDDGTTAVIEMAACAGLPLVENRKDPLKTTTYGVGQMILNAAEKGVKKIIVGLGGSATNDGGCGAAAAAGVKFFNDANIEFIPVGGNTHEIARIDTSQKASVLDGIEIVTMCDINNPAYGPHGAAHIFGPQKGATPEMVAFLDDGIHNLCEIIKRDIGCDSQSIPGTGAAGALGAGMIAFFGSRLEMGIETVLDTVNFNHVVKGADMVITGEGKLDSQSLSGKVVIGVARRAKMQNVPVVVIAGGADSNIDAIYDMGVTAVFTINRMPEDFSISRYKSEENLALTVDNLFRLLSEMKI